MKRVLYQLFNVLMACVVLLSSTGFGLVEHSCQMRGKKKTMVVAFSDAKSTVCTDAADARLLPLTQPVVKKTECCQDDQRYENVTVSSSLSQQVAKIIKTVTETVLAGVGHVLVWLTGWLFTSRSSVALLPAASLPVPSGRDILTFVRQFLL